MDGLALRLVVLLQPQDGQIPRAGPDEVPLLPDARQALYGHGLVQKDGPCARQVAGTQRDALPRAAAHRDDTLRQRPKSRTPDVAQRASPVRRDRPAEVRRGQHPRTARLQRHRECLRRPGFAQCDRPDARQLERHCGQNRTARQADHLALPRRTGCRQPLGPHLHQRQHL